MKSIILKILKKTLRARGYEVIRSLEQDPKVFELYNCEYCYQLFPEVHQIYNSVKSVSKIKGDIAEVGTYQGGSARIICEAKGDKHLFCFDTFEGLPFYDKEDKNINMGLNDMYETSLELVKNNLKDYSKVSIHKAVFPRQGTEVLKDTKFSFIFLDVDTYRSTKECLEFFYDKINKGGIIMTHDYNNGNGQGGTGVKKAFDEFFKNKPQNIIKLLGTQAMVVI